MTAKRIGRPPKPEAEKRQQIGVRTSPDLKARLEAAAAANGRSVAQEAEFRLQDAFDLADLLGGDRIKAIAIEIGNQIRRAEEASGKSWHQDIATHEAASLLLNDKMKRSRPTPPNQSKWVELWRRINEVDARMRALREFLLNCNVIAEGRNALLTLLPSQAEFLRPYRDMPRDGWRNSSEPDEPVTDEESKLLADTLAEYRSLERERIDLVTKAEQLRQPVLDARAQGKAIFDLLVRDD